MTRPSIPQLLDFAAANPGTYNGTLGLKITAELGVTPARYFQLLSRAIDTDEALQHDAVTTNRLRRLRTHLYDSRGRRLGA